MRATDEQIERVRRIADYGLPYESIQAVLYDLAKLKRLEAAVRDYKAIWDRCDESTADFDPVVAALADLD